MMGTAFDYIVKNKGIELAFTYPYKSGYTGMVNLTF
jgi:hypothetical protein